MTLAGHYRETLLKHYCVLTGFRSAADYMFEVVSKRGENLTTKEVMRRAGERYSAQMLFDLEQFYAYGLNKSLCIDYRVLPDEHNFLVRGEDSSYFKKCYWDKDEQALVELVFCFREGFGEDSTPTFDEVDVESNEFECV